MRKILLFAALLFIPLCASAQTADEIIANYVTARGGLAKIKAIQSERIRGTIVFAQGMQGPFVLERERPLKLHVEISFGELTLSRTYDGKSAGWIYNPLAPNPAVVPMTASDLRNIFEEADFEGPFIDLKAKGNQVEFAGKTAVEGKPAYKLKLTDRNGDVSYFSFDASSFFLLRWQVTRKSGDKAVTSETFFRDFHEVDGLQYPFLIETNLPDTGDSQKIIADKIEVNVAIAPAHFAKPNPPALTAPPVAAPADAPKPN